jgi:hypothetical protein
MKILDAEAIIARATPLAHQHAPEIQPFGHLIRMPIALSETACKESVENDLLVSDVIRRNELQAWFLAEHVVDAPLVRA